MDEAVQIDRYGIDRKPSFVDLRDFAQVYEHEVTNREDFLGSRVSLYANGRPGPVGTIALDSSSGTVDSMPNDEFVLILEGSLTLGDVTLTKGGSAVLPHGAKVDWRSSAGTLAVYLRYRESSAAGSVITPTQRDPTYLPSAKPAPEVLLGPPPECRNFNDYRVDDGRFACGTWASTAYHRRGFAYGHYEIMHLIEGSVTLEDFGVAKIFKTGDTVLAERGSNCAWHSCEDVTKVFAIYRPN